MLKRFHRAIAALAILAVTACGSGNTNSGGSLTPSPPTTGGSYTQNIVGIGDSLTAGTQSGTTMGAPGQNPLSPLPGNLVPPTQENGWFALFFAQANGIALDPAQYNVDTALGNAPLSPLPLIASPGIGGQVLLSSTGTLFTTHPDCDTFDQQAYSLTTLGGVRASLANKVYDLGIPGITMHEALTMTAPLTGPPPGPVSTPSGLQCPGYPAIPGDPTSGALQEIVNSESANFYPVLGGYAKAVQPLTQIGVAISLKPQLTTVWLGANDLLKYAGSGGRSPITDTPAQFQTDLTSIVAQLKGAGSKVIVAELPTVLETGGFFQGGVQPAPSQSVFYYLQAFSKGAISPVQAQGVVTALAQPEPAGCGVGANGYLTATGFFSLLTLVTSGNFTGTSCQLDPSGAGSGLGPAYLTDSFAASVAQLNAGYNQIIDSVGQASGTPVVPINASFNQMYQQSNTAPYVFPVDSKGDTADLRWGGGILTSTGCIPRPSATHWLPISSYKQPTPHTV